MSERIKYIVVNDEIPILFPDFVGHDEVAKRFSGVTSAGFVQLIMERDHTWDDDRIIPFAYGESVSLKLKSNPERDTDILRYMFRRE